MKVEGSVELKPVNFGPILKMVDCAASLMVDLGSREIKLDSYNVFFEFLKGVEGELGPDGLEDNLTEDLRYKVLRLLQ